MSNVRVVVAGGGAAGFFAAIACAERNPEAAVTLYEATAHPLAKVRISGGGRCNVTHACFDPRELAANYPRGGRELLGAFHRWSPLDTVAWFAARGVELKAEADGRMFPVTDDSATIVDCLTAAAAGAGVEVRTRLGVRHATRVSGPVPSFQITLTDDTGHACDRLLIATGGNRSSTGLAIAAALGHAIEPLVPSLFTFHVTDKRLEGLSGVALEHVALAVPGTKLTASGPLLVTHGGLSGPAVLKLSAWGARELAAKGHVFPLRVNFMPSHTRESLLRMLVTTREAHARKQAAGWHPPELPARLWERLLVGAGLEPGARWAGISNAALGALATQLTCAELAVVGKSMNKEEFVTCGGVRLSEVDFRTMQSKRCPGLHFAGEVLDIDGITGGFNFQAAWTTGWLAGQAMAQDFAARNPQGARRAPGTGC